MFRTVRHANDQYIILANTGTFERFYTTIPAVGEEETRRYSDKGELWYDILGYAHDSKDAQMQLHGTFFA